MPNIQVFACPSCGATLAVEGKEFEIKCQFCGNTVLVPEELRPKPSVGPAAAAPPGVGSPAAYKLQKLSMPAFLILMIPLLLVLCLFLAVFLTGVASFAGALFSPGTPTPARAYTDISLSLHNGEFVHGGRWIAVDGDGNLYVGVYDTGWIYQYDANGQYLGQWLPEGDTPLRNITADAAGAVYVVRQGAILKYDGATARLLGKYKGSDFFEDVALLPDGGFLAFSDVNGDDLLRLNAQGTVLSRVHNAISGQTGNPELTLRVASDGAGNMYALGTYSSYAVFKFTPQGEFVTQFGGQGDAAGQFRAPRAIVGDRQGNVYVSDTAGIKVFDGDGHYLRLLELPDFNTPAGLFLSSKEEIFTVSDAYEITDDVYEFVLP